MFSCIYTIMVFAVAHVMNNIPLHLYLATSDNYPAEAMTAMLELINDVNSAVDTFGINLLMLAAMYGHPNVLRSIISVPGLKIDAEVWICFHV